MNTPVNMDSSDSEQDTESEAETSEESANEDSSSESQENGEKIVSQTKKDPQVLESQKSKKSDNTWGKNMDSVNTEDSKNVEDSQDLYQLYDDNVEEEEYFHDIDGESIDYEPFQSLSLIFRVKVHILG